MGECMHACELLCKLVRLCLCEQKEAFVNYLFHYIVNLSFPLNVSVLSCQLKKGITIMLMSARGHY